MSHLPRPSWQVVIRMNLVTTSQFTLQLRNYLEAAKFYYFQADMYPCGKKFSLPTSVLRYETGRVITVLKLYSPVCQYTEPDESSKYIHLYTLLRVPPRRIYIQVFRIKFHLHFLSLPCLLRASSHDILLYSKAPQYVVENTNYDTPRYAIFSFSLLIKVSQVQTSFSCFLFLFPIVLCP